MSGVLIVGIVLFVGFVFGELARAVRLPKVTGYILAGVALNPRLTHIVPADFPDQTQLITNIALAFITFSVGGTLFLPRIRQLGRTILWITVLEAEMALLAVVVGFMVFGCVFRNAGVVTCIGMFVPLSILLGTLASPTDPSATLAVAHEYDAQGDVTSTIMGVAAIDDVFGIINYSLAVGIAQVLVLGSGFSLGSVVMAPLGQIFGALAVGVVYGLLFNGLMKLLKRETEGALIVLIFALLALCFGTAHLVRADELLATMVMGCFVVNFNPNREKIFAMLERYTEELIFVLFFTLSGMHLDFGALLHAVGLVVLFVLLRAGGKFLGTALGAHIAHAPPKVKKYAAFGLIPQGGIVVGLALLIQANPAFKGISDVLIGVVIGSTVFHEIVGPVLARTALARAGEIKPRQA